MIIKLFLLNICLVSFVFGISGDKSLNNNVCGDRNERHFAVNTRGCAWFWYCNAHNIALSQNRCPEGFRFNYDDQVCDYPENVDCDFDDRLLEYECPGDALVTLIPHPQSCKFFTILLSSYKCLEVQNFSHSRLNVYRFVLEKSLI